MIVFVVFRRDDAGGRRLPGHILLVGTGTAIWGVGMGDVVLDHLGDGLPPEWSAAPLAFVGGLILMAGLYKMIEILRSPRPAPVAVADHPPGLPERNSERIAYTRAEMRVLFALAMVGLIGGFAAFENQADRLERAVGDTRQLAGQVVRANREGCERTNTLRINQAQIIIAQSRREGALVSGNLGDFERIRKAIEQGQRARKRAIARLRESVNGRGIPGKPYKVDCVEAYP
ncbi:MAG: hypothetical protein LC798_13005 [Chloroflexi bacterium]|nr:hypothetical protein [Chloroflexota bacterium]